jgi:syndecan 1/integrin beta 3
VPVRTWTSHTAKVSYSQVSGTLFVLLGGKVEGEDPALLLRLFYLPFSKIYFDVNYPPVVDTPILSCRYTCQSWGSAFPHKHAQGYMTQHLEGGDTPSEGPSHNFCRNPDGEKTIWCFTNNLRKSGCVCKSGSACSRASWSTDWCYVEKMDICYDSGERDHGPWSESACSRLGEDRWDYCNPLIALCSVAVRCRSFEYGARGGAERRCKLSSRNRESAAAWWPKRTSLFDFYEKKGVGVRGLMPLSGGREPPNKLAAMHRRVRA